MKLTPRRLGTFALLALGAGWQVDPVAEVKVPAFPDRWFDVTRHGAAGDGKTLSTTAIQEAIDAASKEGGRVRFPAGTYLTGAITLRSGVALVLEEGAVLLGSRRLEDYQGKALIQGEGLEDVAILGKGLVDGSGDAFRDKSKHRPKNLRLENCRRVLVEGVRWRSSGSWMQHYRLCEDVTLRELELFNHASFNNDGLDIDSCTRVLITGCRVDTDDDGIVLKSISDRPCRDVRISDCAVSSHCNALKMGTESGGGFVNIAISRCKVTSPSQSKVIYGKQRGLAGVALEIVDGGSLENVTVSDIDIRGVTAPVFLRLGNRARPYGRTGPIPVGTFRRVLLSNITAEGVSSVGCAVSGIPGHRIEGVVFENLRLDFEGGGTEEDAKRPVPEREQSYPESTMFGTLPAYGFYVRHARGLEFRDVILSFQGEDRRPAMFFDDARDVRLVRVSAKRDPGVAGDVVLMASENVSCEDSPGLEIRRAP